MMLWKGYSLSRSKLNASLQAAVSGLALETSHIYLYSCFLKYKKGYLKLQLKKIIIFLNTYKESFLPGQIQ